MRVRKAISVAMALGIALAAAVPSRAQDANFPYFRFNVGRDGKTTPPVTPTNPFMATANMPTPGKVDAPFLGYLSAAVPATFEMDAGSAAIPGLTLQSSGTFAGVPTQVGTYAMRFVARASDGRVARVAAQVQILDVDGTVEPVIYATNGGNGRVAIPYSGARLTSSNVVGPTYSVASGGVPGVSLSQDGNYQGTPTTSGTFPVSFRVTGSDGASKVSQVYNVTVLGAVNVAMSAPGPGKVGRQYAATVAATNATSPSFAVASGGVPGLTLAGTSFRGTPTTAGTFPVQFRASSSDGATGVSETYQVVVEEADVGGPATVSADVPANGMVNRLYLGGVTSTGLVSPTYSYASSPIPGIDVQPDGTVTGAPTETGIFAVRFRAQGTDGRSEISDVRNVRVDAQDVGFLRVKVFAPKGGVVGDSLPNGEYFISNENDGYPARVYNEFHDGQLPPGITYVEPDGFRGTFTQAGTFTSRFRAVASDGRTAISDPVVIVVKQDAADFTVYAELVQSMKVGYEVPYPTLAGVAETRYGRDPDTWELPYVLEMEGTLPTGIFFDANWMEFYGTAESAGTFQARFKATMTNGGGVRYSPTYTYVVSEPTPEPLKLTLSNTVFNGFVQPNTDPAYASHVSTRIRVTGGTGPYAYSAKVVSGDAFAHAGSRGMIADYGSYGADFSYYQTTAGSRVFKLCAKDATDAEICSMDLTMTFKALADSFTWSTSFSNASPSCSAGKTPFSYTVNISDDGDAGWTYAVMPTVQLSEGAQATGEPVVTKLGRTSFRVAGELSRLGRNPQVRVGTLVQRNDGLRQGNSNPDVFFTPTFGDCNVDDQVGGPFEVAWNGPGARLNYNVNTYAGAIMVPAAIYSAYGPVKLARKPVKTVDGGGIASDCYTFPHEFENPATPGQNYPWEATTYFTLLTKDQCSSAGPDEAYVQFEFVDGLGRIAGTRIMTLSGWK